jgi:hypothetical protein
MVVATSGRAPGRVLAIAVKQPRPVDDHPGESSKCVTASTLSGTAIGRLVA